MAKLWSFLVLIIMNFNFITGQDFYSHSVKNFNGEMISLEQFRGKVTLVVNVASECGYTDSTYKALKRLQDILGYGDHFSVLAFPCNQFGQQEPDDAEQILKNMVLKYDIEFPLFDKIEVSGENANSAFLDLIDQSQVVPDWNFYKYLVGPDGKVLSVWGTKIAIEDIFEVIQSAVTEVKTNKNKSTESSNSKDEL